MSVDRIELEDSSGAILMEDSGYALLETSTPDPGIPPVPGTPMLKARLYPSLPSLPPRGFLPPSVSVVLPLARTNLVTNPSIELATTGYTNTGTLIARAPEFQYHGTYSLQVTPSGSVNTGAYYTIALTAGTTYAISAKYLCGEGTTVTTVPGKEMKLWVADTSGNPLATTVLFSTGRWQWPQLIYHERIGATRRIYFTRGDSTFGANSIYVDGVQVEAITDGVLQATTYIDGDQIGLLPGQQPPAYGWNGTPHASTSYRTILTRAGGYLMNLQTAYGFMLTGMIGLGMAAPNNVSIPYSVLDGARYLRTTKLPRTLSLPGRFQADTIYEQMTNQSAMRAALDRDAVPVQQPLLLQFEPQDDCGNVIGDLAYAQCLYAGGLEGNESNYPAEDAAPTFTMYMPFLIGGSAGAALTVQQSVTGTRGILKRSASGAWAAVGAGVSTGNTIYALLIGRDGKIYAAGDFTAMSGVANTLRIAYFDPADSAWHAMGTGADADVRALAEGPDGSIYAGGAFTSMGGVASTKCIARWNGSAWVAMGSGGGASTTRVYSLKWNAASTYLYVGGDFTDIGGSGADYLARWSGSAWSVVSSATALNGIVYALERVPGNTLGVYVGGAFTNAAAIANADRIALWSGSTYSALSTGMNGDVLALTTAPSGLLYVGGGFTTAGGVTVAYNAVWNGTGFVPLGTGQNATLYAIAKGIGQSLYIGGAFSTADPFGALDSGFVIWTGSSFALPDVQLAAGTTVNALAIAADGTIYVGTDLNTSPTIAAGVTTVDNDKPAFVYPVITINGPSSGTSRITSILNNTTGAAIYLNLKLSAGETAVFNLNPQQLSFLSNVQGDLTGTIIPGSNPAQFYLAPGDNSISLLADASSVTATMSWQRRYNGYADLVSP